MSERGTKTKNAILQEAKRLFMQKGFAAVSMSDVCEAVRLSRGGLYRHFSSTKDIFVALLTSDKNDWEEEMAKAIGADFSVVKMLSYYLEQVYKGILDGEGRLSLATYEFGRTVQDADDFLVKRYAQAVDMMERLLRYGQSRGEILDFDAHAEAEHLVIYTMPSAGLMPLLLS